MSYADIARNLENQSRMSINNAMNIVQTEGHRIQIRSALDSGNKARAKGADLVKVWDSTLDSKTRDHHRELDGQVRELDEDFEVDGITVSAPGQFGMPSEDCRCRCALLIKPRWDVTGSFTKRNNETGELLEFKNASDYQEFKQKYWGMVDKSGGSGIMREDEVIGRSVGASAKNYPVRLPDGNHAKFAEGSTITKIKVFAGNGTDVPIRNAVYLENDYGIPADKWQKVRGEAIISQKMENDRRAELHWYEADGERR